MSDEVGKPEPITGPDAQALALGLAYLDLVRTLAQTGAIDTRTLQAYLRISVRSMGEQGHSDVVNFLESLEDGVAKAKWPPTRN